MIVKLTKMTTAPHQKCPKCGSGDVVWLEVEGLKIGFLRCRACGNEGWAQENSS
jgi:transcription elongation factor Elf1